MNYTEFAIKYTREHYNLTNDELSKAIPVAFERKLQSYYPEDILNWQHGDLIMQFQTWKALEKIGIIHPVIQAARDLAAKKIGFGEFKRIVRENS